jgi:predicted Zn-dependent protease
MDSISNGIPKNDLPISTEVVSCLMDIGDIAMGRRQQPQSENIVNRTIAAWPTNEFPLICLAVRQLNFGKIASAIKILAERASKLNPDRGLAISFLAIAVRALGQEEAACDLMRLVCTVTSDSAAKAMADSFLFGKDIS